MSLREWLIAIGALIIIAIILDGLRRMRRARKDAIAISSGMGADDIEGSPLDDDFNPELPNGGARPASRDSLEKGGYLKAAGQGKSAVQAKEPVHSRSEPTAGEPGQETFGPAEAGPEPVAAEESISSADVGADSHEEILGEPRVVRPGNKPSRKDSGKRKGKAPVEPPMITDVEEDTAKRAAERRQYEPSSGQPEAKAGANRPAAEEVVVINVLAKDQKDFSGKALKKLFEVCGLEHGDLDIYHRHETAETSSPVQFSVANAVEPGTFTPATMDDMSTPGISFFMSLPGPTDSMQAFDFMLETAQAVVNNLDGELKDERRSVMTAQTIEHCRQRIREYERKRRFKR